MVFSCSYCKRKCVKGVGCFSFPKDKRLCDQWLIACGFDVHPKNNTSKLKLCSFHFEDSCLTVHNGRKQLKPRCVPTIFHDKKPVENVSPFIKEERFPDDEAESVVKMEYEVDDHYNNYLNNSNFVIKCEPHTSDEESIEYKPKLPEDMCENMLKNISTVIVKEEDWVRKKDNYFDSVNIYLGDINK